MKINDSYDGIDLDLDIDDQNISLKKGSIDEEDLQLKLEPEIDVEKNYDPKLVAFETFLISNDYFGRIKELDDSIPQHWKIGTYGNLIQMNLMKWWHFEMVEAPANVVGIEQINSDEKTYLKYKIHASAHRKKIPFGIGRTIKKSRVQFNSKQFLFVNKPSKHQRMEFFVKPDTSKSWLESWYKILEGKLKEIGFRSDKLEAVHQKVSGDIDPNDYFFEKYEFKYHFPFGVETIAIVNNKIDSEFQNEDDKMTIDSLRYMDESSEGSFFPHIIRVTMDIEKTILALTWENYVKGNFEDIKNSSAVFDPRLSPIKGVILPEDGSTDELNEITKSMHQRISEKINISLEDDSKPIDLRLKHYRELGVPYFIFIDDSFIKKRKVDLYDAYNGGWLKLEESQLWEYINKGCEIKQ